MIHILISLVSLRQPHYENRSESLKSACKDEELARQKRKDELEQIEQALEKNCPDYVRISHYYGL